MFSVCFLFLRFFFLLSSGLLEHCFKCHFDLSVVFLSVSPHIAFSGCSRCHIMYTENLPQSAGVHIYQFEVRSLTSLYISLFSAISKVIVCIC